MAWIGGVGWRRRGRGDRRWKVGCRVRRVSFPWRRRRGGGNREGGGAIVGLLDYDYMCGS